MILDSPGLLLTASTELLLGRMDTFLLIVCLGLGFTLRNGGVSGCRILLHGVHTAILRIVHGGHVVLLSEVLLIVPTDLLLVLTATSDLALLLHGVLSRLLMLNAFLLLLSLGLLIVQLGVAHLLVLSEVITQLLLLISLLRGDLRTVIGRVALLTLLLLFYIVLDLRQCFDIRRCGS